MRYPWGGGGRSSEIITNGNKLKRKNSTDLEDIAIQECKKSTVPETIGKNDFSVYPDSHVRPAYVEVKVNDARKKTKSQNLMHIAKTVYSLKVGATDMKPRTLGGAELKFCNKELANDFVRSIEVKEHGILAFIPRYRTEKIGLIKGIPTDVSLEEIIYELESPCRILKANRLNRKTNKAEWVSSETLMVAFEGNTLPDYIKIFGLCKVKVHLYVERIKACQNCFKYGHNTETCRSPKRCAICNQPALEDHSCALDETVKCLHCSK